MVRDAIGDYFFISGLVISIVLGFSSDFLGDAAKWFWMLLVVFGLFVGLLKIPGDKSREFLLYFAALMVITFSGKDYIDRWEAINFIGGYLKVIFTNLLTFTIPAAIVTAFKSLWKLAQIDEPESDNE